MTAKINPQSPFASEQGRQDRWETFATIRMDLQEYAQELSLIRSAMSNANSTVLPVDSIFPPDGREVCMVTNFEIELQACLDRLDTFIRDEVWGDAIMLLTWRVEFLGESAWALKTEVNQTWEKALLTR